MTSCSASAAIYLSALLAGACVDGAPAEPVESRSAELTTSGLFYQGVNLTGAERGFGAAIEESWGPAIPGVEGIDIRLAQPRPEYERLGPGQRALPRRGEHSPAAVSVGTVATGSECPVRLWLPCQAEGYCRGPAEAGRDRSARRPQLRLLQAQQSRHLTAGATHRIGRRSDRCLRRSVAAARPGVRIVQQVTPVRLRADERAARYRRVGLGGRSPAGSYGDPWHRREELDLGPGRRLDHRQ